MLCNLCPIPFHHYGNKICFNQTDVMSYGEIQDTCAMVGGQLLRTVSTTMQNVIKEYLGSNLEIFGIIIPVFLFFLIVINSV